jgi:nucleoside permease NupC
VAAGEFRGVPVGHREAALLGTVGLIAAADRFRTGQEGWIAVCGSEPELDLEEPVGVASPLRFLLGIDHEEGDEPVAVMPASAAPQDYVRVVGVELLDR